MTKLVAFRNFGNTLKNGFNNIIIVGVNLLGEVIFHELLIVHCRSVQFIDKQAQQRRTFC
jgi:hypothetical protein